MEAVEVTNTDANATPAATAIELDVKDNNEDITNKETAENQQQIQKQMMVHTYPSLKDVIDRKVSWKEFFGVYNVLRIAIAALCAIIICLLVFGIVWIINPNKCYPARDDPDKFQWNPLKNQIMNWLELTLMFGPVIKLFGYEWKWTAKKTNISLLLFIFAMFIVFIPYAFIYDTSFIFYAAIAIGILVVVFVIYVFCVSGFYVFWMLSPFIIAFIVTSAVIFASSYFFRYVIGSESYFFSPCYSLFLTVLQMILFKFNIYSFPYKCGRCCTCPCNKGKTRTTGDADHKQVTVESELSDMMLFWWSMLTITVVETFRIAEYVALLDQPRGFGGLYFFFASNILMEIVSRNCIVWEIISKILKKDVVEPRTHMMSIYYGAKLQAEWIPIWCALLMNIFGYGPFENCDYVRDIELSATLNVNGEWWLFGALFASEIMQALGSELMVRIARCFGWYGRKNEKGEDPPRKITLVKVNLVPMIWILIQCYIVSYEAFILDKNNRVAIHS